MNWRDKAGNKIKRNGPCPCGSGKKFKKCCFLRIGNELNEKCPCGSGEILKDCCHVTKEISGNCKACGKPAKGIVRADKSAMFKCDNCGFTRDSRPKAVRKPAASGLLTVSRAAIPGIWVNGKLKKIKTAPVRIIKLAE